MSLTTQIIGLTMIGLLILILFVAILSSTFDIYYLDTTLNIKQKQAQKVLKFAWYLAVILLIIDVFAALIVLIRFMIKYDIIDIIWDNVLKIKKGQKSISKG